MLPIRQCYKDNKTIIKASSMFGVFVVFCKPILAMFLQRKHQMILNACCYYLL